VLVGNASWRKRLPPRASEEEAVRVLADAPFLAFDVDLPLIRDHPLIAEHEAEIFGDHPLARVSLIMPNFGALRNAAIAGGGVTVVPRYVAAGAIKAKQLYELYEPQDRYFNQIYLAHRDEPQGEAVQRIIDELRRRAPRWETKQAKTTTTAEDAQPSREASAKSRFYEQHDGK
jgi:DNA-binding transcriptional LysR family regulator